MTNLFNYIKAKIASDLPEWKTVRRWRNQYNRSNKSRDENAFRYPACFIEFVTEDMDNQAIGYCDIDLIVRFHIGFDNYTLEKDEDFELMERFEDVMFRFRSAETDNVHFTTFQQNVISDEADDDNVDLQILEYRTKYRQMTTYSDGVEIAPVDLDLDGEIIDSI